MKLIVTILLTMATLIPAWSAQVFPATTNRSQILFGTNTFWTNTIFRGPVSGSNNVATTGIFYGDGSGLTNVSSDTAIFLSGGFPQISGEWLRLAESSRTGIVDVLCIGDSITAGAFSPLSVDWTNGFVGQLRTMLQGKYRNGGQGIIGPWRNGISASQWRPVYQGGWVDIFGETNSAGPFAYAKKGNASGGSTYCYFAEQPFTSVTVIYAVNPNSDTGVAPVRLQTISPGQNHYFTITNSATEKFITLTTNMPGTDGQFYVYAPTNGYLYLHGVMFASATNGVRVNDCSQSGTSSSNFIVYSNSAFATMSYAKSNVSLFASAIKPKLTIFAMSVGDFRNQTSLNSYSNFVQTAIESFTNYGPVLLIGSNPRSPNDAVSSTYSQIDYHNVLGNLSKSNNAGMVDILSRWGSYSNALRSGVMFDTVHPNIHGHRDYQSAILEELGENPNGQIISSRIGIGKQTPENELDVLGNISSSGIGNFTNGLVMYQLPWIPTNSIPSSSATITNYVHLNLTNIGPCWIATNIAASGSFLILTPTTTLTVGP